MNESKETTPPDSPATEVAAATNPPATAAPTPTPAPLLGLAGCGIIFLLTALGTLVGGLIGMAMLPPAPARTAEIDGLLYLLMAGLRLVNAVLRTGPYALGGGVVGFVAGLVIARKHSRRVKSGMKS